MRTSTLLPASLEPLSKRNPQLIVDNDLKLKVLETLEKEGPLNLKDLRDKVRVDLKTLSRIIKGLEEEGSIIKPKTRYNLTELGRGVVEGFIKPSPDEKLDVLSIVASHPNTSTVELLRLRSSEPGYLDVVKLYSALDELRDRGLVKRNDGGWEVGGSFIEKIFPILNDTGSPTNGTPVKERIEKQPARINKSKKEREAPRRKEIASKVDAPPVKETVVIPIPPLASDIPVEEITDTDPVLPSINNLVDVEEIIVANPNPTDDLPKEIIILENPTLSPVNAPSKEETVIASNPSPPPTSKPTPVMNLAPPTFSETMRQLGSYTGIRISQALNTSPLFDKKRDEAISLLKAAVVKLQGVGVQISEESLTNKGSASDELLVETLHAFFVLKHARIREFLEFCSKNAKSFKRVPAAILD